MNAVNRELIQIMKNDRYYKIFEQNGVPLHQALPVRQFLNVTFFGEWNERRGAIE